MKPYQSPVYKNNNKKSVCRKQTWSHVSVWKPHWPLSWQTDLRLPVTSFTETEELEDDSVGPSGEEPHAGLQLLVPPLKRIVHWPQVLDGGHVEEIVLRQPRVESLEFICGREGKTEDMQEKKQWLYVKQLFNEAHGSRPIIAVCIFFCILFELINWIIYRRRY